MNFNHGSKARLDKGANELTDSSYQAAQSRKFLGIWHTTGRDKGTTGVFYGKS
ncbi:MAG: hypothetical protein V4451_00130 [Pseudomonadota bacterium]